MFLQTNKILKHAEPCLLQMVVRALISEKLFSLHFLKTLAVKQQSGIKKRIYLRRKQKLKSNIHPIKTSQLLISNDSYVPTFPKSSNIPQFLYRTIHFSASIAETGNEQCCRIITIEGIWLAKQTSN